MHRFGPSILKTIFLVLLLFYFLHKFRFFFYDVTLFEEEIKAYSILLDIVAPFFGDQGYLVSVWHTILSHDWTFNFEGKGEKSSKHPFEKI